jgi:hypothetical protein
MNPLLLLGLGAAAMYYLDPQQGARRRAQAREQMTKAQQALRERAYGASQENKDKPSQTPESAGHLGR